MISVHCCCRWFASGQLFFEMFCRRLLAIPHVPHTDPIGQPTQAKPGNSGMQFSLFLQKDASLIAITISSSFPKDNEFADDPSRARLQALAEVRRRQDAWLGAQRELDAGGGDEALVDVGL